MPWRLLLHRRRTPRSMLGTCARSADRTTVFRHDCATLCACEPSNFRQYRDQNAAGLRALVGCDRPKPLLASRTCDVPAPPVRLPQHPSELVNSVLKRQAPVLVIALATACAVAGTATGDPSVSAKQAQAQQVMAHIRQL